jgi:uncharacterized membrane protein YidH (DUF202 family)
MEKSLKVSLSFIVVAFLSSLEILVMLNGVKLVQMPFIHENVLDFLVIGGALVLKLVLMSYVVKVKIEERKFGAVAISFFGFYIIYLVVYFYKNTEELF